MKTSVTGQRTAIDLILEFGIWILDWGRAGFNSKFKIQILKSLRVFASLRFLLFFAWSASAALGQTWKELGPAPITTGSYTGRLSAVVCSPTDANRYFVAGADGGVWRTTDGGVTWTPLTDRMLTTAIGALALDPTNENLIYAGTGEANYANHSRYGLGLLKSADGGNTWAALAQNTFAGRCFSKIVIHPQNPQTLYAAITRAGGFPSLAASRGHPQRNGPFGVFRSDDGGVNWTLLANGLPALDATDLAIDPSNPGVLYAAIGYIFGSADNGVYKTIDGGASWTKLAGGLPTASLGRISIAVAPSQTTRLYALIANACDASGGGGGTLGAFRSDNSGANWTSVPVGNMQATYGWYLSFVSVRPTDANAVFMGGLELRRSINSGTSWNTVTPPHVDLHAAAWDAAGRLLIGDDGGLHRSTDLGASWAPLNTGLGVIQFYAGLSTHPTNDLIYLGGNQDNGSNRRTTDTKNWTNSLGGDGGWTQIDQNNPNIAFAEFQGSTSLYRSTNGGASFTSSSSGINGSDRNCFLPPCVIDPTNSSRVLFGTHRVYQSINGGVNWSVLSGDLTDGAGAIRTLAIAPSNGNYVYAATNDGNVQVSTNGGAAFQLILDNHPGWPRTTREIFVHPADPQTAYLATAYFGEIKIRRTTNAGQTWQALDANFPDIPVNTVAADVRGAKPIVFAGADDGLYRSINDGGSWHRYGSGLPHTPVIDIRLEPARKRMTVATQGRGAWSIAVGLPGDMDGNGVVDFFDIDPFVLALTDPDAYAQQFPNVDPVLNGDMNGDGVLDFFDIDGFIELLTG